MSRAVITLTMGTTLSEYEKIDIPVVDAACDGRAHPLGTMGSLGLTGTVVQLGCGGNPEKGMYTEIEVIAAVDKASDLIRTASAAAGGLIEVARNPVKKSYLETTSAIGAYEYARKIGEEYAKGKTQDERICNAANAVNGTVYAQGVVEELQLETKQLNRLSQRASIWLCRTAWVTRRQ